MRKVNEKEYPIPSHNDIFLKYVLIGEGVDSELLRRGITEEIYGSKVQTTKVLSPELSPEVFFGERAVLDVVLESEAGHFYDLEMQVSGYMQEEQLRFRQYGYRLVGRQLKQCNDYIKLKPFYRIIFMNSMPKVRGRIVRRYKVEDEDNREEPNDTLNRAIVSLPMIKQQTREVGGIRGLTEFETFCYVLAYNPDDAILSMKRRMVDVAVERYNEMKEGNQLLSWTESAEFAEHAAQASLRERTAEAKKLGMEEGKRTSSRLLLPHKYGADDTRVGILTTQRVGDALTSILECSTYNVLKVQLTDRKAG